MTKSIILIAFILILPSAIFAQNGGSRRSKSKKFKGEAWTLDKQVAFKCTPTSLLDSYGGLLPLGFEYYLNEKFGISFDVGIPLYYVLNNYRDDLQKKINGDYRLRLDARQYFRLREKNRMYFGAEVFFRRQNMVLKNSFLHFVDGSCYNFSAINAIKDIYGVGIVMGYARKLSDHLILEGNVGVGLRLINMKSDIDISQSKPFDVGKFSTLVPANGDKVGDNDINIYMPFAIKIGYLF